MSAVLSLLLLPGCLWVDQDAVSYRRSADIDGDGVVVYTDCDDLDPAVLGPATWFGDGDSDGWGDSDKTEVACEASAGFVADGGDCDDTVAAVNPGAVEICGDGLDNNCDASAGSCGWAGEVALEPIPAIRGQAPSDRLGLEVVALGDTDGDGNDDFCVSAYRADSRPGVDAGVVGLITDPVTRVQGLTSAASALFLGVDADDRTGRSMAAAGDLTGNGQETLAIGAERVALAGARGGAVYLTPLAATGDVDLSTAIAVLGEEREQLGRSIAAAGDADGDGYADLWIGSPGWGDSRDIGASWLVHGPISATTVITDADAWKITGASSGDGVGWRVAAGDVTGDGFVDLLTSAPGLDDGSGAVLVVVGPQSSDVDAADATPIWGNTLDNLGQDVLLADMDGDGHLDLVLGAPGTSDDGDSAGVVAVLPGPVTVPVNLNDAPTRLAGDQGGERVGSAVSAGDVNADGHVDLFIGAEGWDDTRGRAFLVLGPIEGSHDLTETQTDAWFPGVADTDRVGGEAEILGDLDGDGFLELGLGGWGASDEAGVAYVLPGGAGL